MPISYKSESVMIS